MKNIIFLIMVVALNGFVFAKHNEHQIKNLYQDLKKLDTWGFKFDTESRISFYVNTLGCKQLGKRFRKEKKLKSNGWQERANSLRSQGKQCNKNAVNQAFHEKKQYEEIEEQKEKEIFNQIKQLKDASMKDHIEEFKYFDFNDENKCVDFLGLQKTTVPNESANELVKDKSLCIQAYIDNDPCQKQYDNQKDYFGLPNGIRSNTNKYEKHQKKAFNQCGSWLEQRLSQCRSSLQQYSKVCSEL